MNKLYKIIVLLMLLTFTLSIIVAFYTAYRLWQFKQCYDNSFKLFYCEKYKDF